MKHLPNLSPKQLTIGLYCTAIVIISGGIYVILHMNEQSARINKLSADLTSLNAGLATTTTQLQALISQLQDSLTKVVSTNQQNVGNLQQQLGNFQQQVGNISGTVTTLQKLSQTDPQLLAKYSKVFFLSENYAPERLDNIPATYEYSTKKQLTIVPQVLPHLENMISDASSTGVQIYVFSAYRSFAEQKALKGDYTMTYGAGTANSFSADQGYSEHQLGTAVDLITPGLGGVLDGFDMTTAYPWLLANAYKYGFVLSYPKGNGYYVFEPWHWRFVGTQLATDLKNQGKNFYDLDQRTIDTYLVNIFP